MGVAWRVEELTKQDVAVRQLRQAIRLFFAEGDMLAVHTLTSAALTVLADLARKAGIANPFGDEAHLRPEMRERGVPRCGIRRIFSNTRTKIRQDCCGITRRRRSSRS
jgi:hypothetical protein